MNSDSVGGGAVTVEEAGTGRMLAYSSGSFPVGMLLLAISVWLMRLYCPTPDEVEQGRKLLVDPAVFGMISAIVMLFGAVADPLVGFYSDKLTGSRGRRMPFIKIGLFFLLASFMLVWFPPLAGLNGSETGWLNLFKNAFSLDFNIGAPTIINAAWLTAMLLVLHVSFTVVVNPYLALMPEIWESEKGRIRVSIWMSIFGALAQIFVFVVFGPMISNYMDGGGTFLGFAVQDGFKLAAVIGTILTFVAFLPVVIAIRERPHSAQKDVPYGLMKACWETLRNPAFMPYIIAGAMLYGAQFMVQAALPYVVATQVVNQTSSFAPMNWVLSQGPDTISGLMLLGLVVFSIGFYPLVDKLAAKYRRKTLMMISLAFFAICIPLVTLSGRMGIPAHYQLMVVCLLISPGLALCLVVPRAILADIMDLDTERTGYRREAMYNGMEGLLQKIAGGLALMFQGFLFSTFGYSTEKPWGIVLAGFTASVMSIIGIVAFTKYPIQK
jgi:GPH family glycoside/pentoside/hexuronide:cation symporter